MKNYQELKAQLLSDPEFKKEYDALEDDYVKARNDILENEYTVA